jgi:hypothetical protein
VASHEGESAYYTSDRAHAPPVSTKLGKADRRNCRELVRTNSGAPGTPARKGIEALLEQTGVGLDTMQSNISDLLHALNR